MPRADAGVRAESLAADYLIERGLVVVARNFRTRQGEIDLIARDGETLVFVEVRMRTHRSYGGAAASVTPAKRQRWIAASLAYLGRLGSEPPCRFDAVLLDALDPAHIVWERNVIEVE